MELEGRLGVFTAAELIQFLSLGRKSGRLQFRREAGSGVVVFRSGKIIYTATHSVREMFGSILVSRGLISEAVLMEALQRQERCAEVTRLGTILLEMGALKHDDLVAVMRHQTALVLSELVQWVEGSFSFEELELPRRGEIEVEAREFLMSDGLNAEQMLLEAAAGLDESRAVEDGEGLDGTAEAGRTGEGSRSARPAPEPEGSTAVVDWATLQRVVLGLHAPSLRGELMMGLLRLASAAVPRGLLLAVRGTELHDVGQFGFRLSEGRAGSVLPSLCLPAHEASALTKALETGRTLRGPLDQTPGNERLIRALGGKRPREAVVIPIPVGSRMAMVFYGDDGGREEDIGSTAALESTLAEAGLALDENTVQLRVDDLQPTS